MPDDGAAEVTGVDLRRATEALIEARRRNGSGSWFSRHQAWTIAIASAIVAVVSWGVNRWAKEQVQEVQAPVDAAQDERTTELEEALVDETKARVGAVDVLQQNDEDLADYSLEADRYEQQTIEAIAKKVRVKEEDLPDRAPLERAQKRLRGIKERRRPKEAPQ